VLPLLAREPTAGSVVLSRYWQGSASRRRTISGARAPPAGGWPNRRLATQQRFAGGAPRGQTSRGGCAGVTLQRLGKAVGDRWACCLTPGQGDALRPRPPHGTGLCGPRLGDRGALSQAVHAARLAQGVARLPPGRTHQKTRLRRLWATRLLRTRALFERSGRRVLLRWLEESPSQEHPLSDTSQSLSHAR
jgi:Transposase DDE domain